VVVEEEKVIMKEFDPCLAKVKRRKKEELQKKTR